MSAAAGIRKKSGGGRRPPPNPASGTDPRARLRVQRLASQRRWQDREPAADLLIFNNGAQEALESEVKTRFAQTVHLWRNGELGPTRYLDWWRAREGGG